MSKADEPMPGSYDAVQAGCICEPRDGEDNDNWRWLDWLVRGCPIHDTAEASRKPCATCGKCERCGN